MTFQELMQAKGLTINELSKECGIPYATLHNNIEKPISMKVANLKKLSIFFEMSMDDILDILQNKGLKLLGVYREQKSSKLKGNLYHYTQIGFAYNTNRIEGSKLTEDETRLIFETNTLIDGKGSNKVDDVVETANHFYLFDRMLDEVDEPLSESMIKNYHKLLKNGTADARKDWFVVGGDYKSLPNEVGGNQTSKPEDVKNDMRTLLVQYNSEELVTIEQIIDFHYNFEKKYIHFRMEMAELVA